MLESEERGRAKAVSGRDELAEENHIGRSRREKVRNEQTREKLGAVETVVEKIKKRSIQWFRHVERMEGKRLPNAALHGHVCEGKEKRMEEKEDLDGQCQGKSEGEIHRLDQTR